MNKWLIFDADRSLASIGGPARLNEVFGVPPVTVTGGIDQVQEFLKKFITKKTMTEDHPIFGVMEIGESFTLNKRAEELGLRGIIIDTLSVIGAQTREKLCSERKQPAMELQTWGLYGDKMMRFVHLLSRFDLPVIVTSHIDRDRDENGGPIEVPATKGSAKNDVARFFDVIAYAKTTKNREGKAEFSWVVQRDGRQTFAKDRLGVLPPIMPCDIGMILSAYAEEGLHYPKILILGDAGSGKTFSLQTVTNHTLTNQLKEAA
jgi:hypothetical protein